MRVRLYFDRLKISMQLVSLDTVAISALYTDLAGVGEDGVGQTQAQPLELPGPSTSNQTRSACYSRDMQLDTGVLVMVGEKEPAIPPPPPPSQHRLASNKVADTLVKLIRVVEGIKRPKSCGAFIFLPVCVLLDVLE